jgi:hypothetical protein
MKLVTYVVIAKIFTGLAILSIACGAYGAASGSVDMFFGGVCGTIVFASLAAKIIQKCIEISNEPSEG